ncbi:uncharacterized protein AMSG_04202 [Thecamonas trahens ATCC 50062]|uniref:Uncharacterized protein n=1 Tax=Thecamonas trahens ATCC 50062 TaxID=461836 RepID=A0A0L0D9J0_THETB|nr:hypothetical protein AMSG_04202 [Thecamonas trahens ATCC 50062]KNC47968.1 hypothetical protein AMSG_04202 [Thecamonas trahens ATCC 50062]|eukprot:XP_013758985.1 hypothetical protein AMSG_04202 [Thecamonas trahens ATCC 50062]
MYLERKPVEVGRRARLSWWLASPDGRVALVSVVAVVWLAALLLPWHTTKVTRYAQPAANVTAASDSSSCWVLGRGTCTGELYSLSAQHGDLRLIYTVTFACLLAGLVLLLPYAVLTWYDASVWSGVLGVMAGALLAAAVAFFAVGVDEHNRAHAWGKATVVSALGSQARTESSGMNIGWYLAVVLWFLLFAVFSYVAKHSSKRRGGW